MALAEIGARLRLRGAEAFRRDAERGADSVDRLGREADQADRRVTNLGEAARRAGRGLGGLSRAAAGMGAVAGAAAVGGIAVLGSSLLDTATRLEALSGKSRVVFGDQLGMVQKWADASAEAMGLTSTQAVGLAAGLSDLLVPIGFTRGAAAKMSTDIVGLSGALAQWSGGQYDAAGVAEILQGAMLGETDALQALGIAISAADVEAALLAKKQDKLTGNALKQAEAQAIVELIYAKSTDAQESYRLGANKLGTAQAKLRAKVETLRERLATKLTPFFIEGMEFLESKLPTIEGYVDRFAGALGDALRPGSEFRAEMADLGPALADVARFAADVLKMAGNLVSWMVDHEDAVKTFAAAVVAVKLGMVGVAAVNMVAIAAGITGIGTAAGVASTAMFGPLGLIAALTGAAAAFGAYQLARVAASGDGGGAYTDPTGTRYPTGVGSGPLTGPPVRRTTGPIRPNPVSVFPETTRIGPGGVRTTTRNRVATPGPAASPSTLAPTQAQLNESLNLTANLVLPDGRVLTRLVTKDLQTQTARR